MGTAAIDGAAIHGGCDSRFRGVANAFAENFAQGGEVGATVAATVNGKLVVDLWAGHDHGLPRAQGHHQAKGTAHSARAPNITNVPPTTCSPRLPGAGLQTPTPNATRSV